MLLNREKILEKSFEVLNGIEDPDEKRLLQMLQIEKVDIMFKMQIGDLESWPSFLARLEEILDSAKMHGWAAHNVYEMNKEKIR